MRGPQFLILILIASTCVQGEIALAQTTKLGKYSTYPNQLTLSGFSSGGGFAQHMMVSYSSLFRGLAVFQHAFYRCGPGDGIALNYDNACTQIFKSPRELLYSPEKSEDEIQRYAKMGVIEDPSNLLNKRLYVYTGTHNWIHTPDISLKILNVYEPYIKNPDAIRTRAQAANLTLPTNRFGGPCAADAEANYYLANCGLSGAFDALSFLLGENVKLPPPADKDISLEPLQLFDQNEFTKDIKGEHLMDPAGFLYIPRRCKQWKCYVHFYFHGCTAGREFVGDKHIRNSGYLEVGELNNIIMVFPQASSNTGQNKWGCWDTYGLTGELYATQRGAQVTAVRKMMARILGEDDTRKRPHKTHTYRKPKHYKRHD